MKLKFAAYEVVIECEEENFATAAHMLVPILNQMHVNIFFRDHVRSELKKIFETSQYL